MGGESAAIQSTIDRPAPFLMYITSDQLCALGISRSTINRKLRADEWKLSKKGSSVRRGGKREILVSSLPVELQIKWVRLNASCSDAEQTELGISDEIDATLKENEKKLRNALLCLPLKDRTFWINEALRLAQIVIHYGQINPKRRRHPVSGELYFVPAVFKLCEKAVCTDQKILDKEPHRRNQPSPFTLDGWWRKYQKIGLLTFLRSAEYRSTGTTDRRRAVISPGAVDWVNHNWKKFSGPRLLFNAINELASRKKWTIPHESWFYRLWENMLYGVKVFHLEGQKAYQSKLAPYVPRDFSDLEALQVLCGDHSERDVFVLLPDGRTIARPWWTPWYDLRCGLIWGWHLSLEPSSHAAALAYADGVQNFGAQPPARPDDEFYSFLYTDLGRTYRSHNWDGKVIAVHTQTMRPDGSFEMLLVQRHVGIVEDFNLKHLLSRGYNAKEKPVEEVHNVISYWEQNTFPEYCGRSPEKRPEQFRRLLEQHHRFLQGKLAASPFITFGEYRNKLAQRIIKYNSSQHKRITLGGVSIVPLEEFKRLYTTHYEISPETLALLLMKAEKRIIGKNGVQMFRPDWFYYHESMSLYKGMSVEVRYKDDDYSRVWVVLPSGKICEAELTPPTSLINPNKKTLKMVAKRSAHERKVFCDFQLIAQSNLRGETIEDRVAQELEAAEIPTDDLEQAVQSQGGHVHLLTRLDQPRRKAIPKSVTGADVAAVSADSSIFETPVQSNIKEFNYDE